MSTKVSIGHSIALALLFLDQNGNPMLSPPAPDAPPTWAQTTAATESLVPAANGLTANTVALAAGTDDVSVSLAVGGVEYTADLSVEVDPAAQVLGSVQIEATVS